MELGWTWVRVLTTEDICLCRHADKSSKETLHRSLSPDLNPTLNGGNNEYE